MRVPGLVRVVVPVRDDPATNTAGGDSAPGGSWRVLATAGEGLDADRLEPRGVLTRLLLSGLAVVLVVAAGGLLAAQRLAERHVIDETAARSDLMAETLVQPVLSDALVSPDAAERERASRDLDAVVRSGLLTNGVVRVKIWSVEGEVLYSDEARLVGRSFELSPALRRARTDPSTQAGVTDPTRPEHLYEKDIGRLLAVHRPVQTESGQMLLLEVHHDYDLVREDSAQIWRVFAGHTLISLLVVCSLILLPLWWLLARLRRASRQREVVLSRGVDASLDGRRQIAATLHEGVVQELTATSLVVEDLAEGVGRTDARQVGARLRDIAVDLRRTVGGMRSLLIDIYPPHLEHSGLTAALTDLAEPTRARQVPVSFDLLADERALSPSQRNLVYRVVQECLRNAVHDRQARRIDVRSWVDDGSVVFETFDDGHPFGDPDPSTPSGRGAQVMVDLARHQDSGLQVLSLQGSGTRWRLTMRVPR